MLRGTVSMIYTDLDLQEAVADELAFEPSVDATNIGVAAKGGVVTLTGRVANYAEKVAAEKRQSASKASRRLHPSSRSSFRPSTSGAMRTSRRRRSAPWTGT